MIIINGKIVSLFSKYIVNKIITNPSAIHDGFQNNREFKLSLNSSLNLQLPLAKIFVWIPLFYG